MGCGIPGRGLVLGLRGLRDVGKAVVRASQLGCFYRPSKGQECIAHVNCPQRCYVSTVLCQVCLLLFLYFLALSQQREGIGK